MNSSSTSSSSWSGQLGDVWPSSSSASCYCKVSSSSAASAYSGAWSPRAAGASCSSSSSVWTQRIREDATGRYTLVRPESPIEGNPFYIAIELWEKDNDSKNYYTPTRGGAWRKMDRGGVDLRK